MEIIYTNKYEIQLMICFVVKRNSRHRKIKLVKRMASSSSSFFFSLLFIIFAIFSAVGESKTTYFPGGINLQASVKKEAKPKLPYEVQYFPQVVDHFSFIPSGYKIFYQKYLINKDYWHKGGPIFVYTGNEGDIDWFAANTGFMLDIAPKFHALLLFIEVS